MKKHLRHSLFVLLVLAVVVSTIPAVFTSRAEVEEIRLTPHGYIPIALRPENTLTYTPLPTNTPTHSPTSAPPANVQLTFNEYNHPGDDVAGEFVEIKNLGGTTATMTDWTLRDTVPHVFTFPSFTLQSNAAV